MLNKKSILITGGTGSFGKKFTEMILSKYPEVERLVIYSRDELKQFDMSQKFNEKDYPQIRYFIGDVRDYPRFKRACEGIDGIIGSNSLKVINKGDEKTFILKSTIAKIARYAAICNKKSSQRKYLLGWINRSLGGIE